MSLRNNIYRIVSFRPVLDIFTSVRLRDRIAVLIYHEVLKDSDEIAAWTVERESDFIRQLDYLSSRFDIISVEEALTIAGGNKSRSRSSIRPKIAITLDDGWSGNYGVMLPIIKSRKIPVTIFVATGTVQDQLPYWDTVLISAFQKKASWKLDLTPFTLGEYVIDRQGSERWEQIYRLLLALKSLSPDMRKEALEKIYSGLSQEDSPGQGVLKPLSVEELRELASSPLVTIGAHSHCHSLLSQLDSGKLAESIATSKRLLETWTRKQVRYFAYPHGNYDGKVIAALKDAGFECAFTTSPAPWGKKDSFYEIPRIGVGRFDSFECFKIKASGWFWRPGR